DDAVPARIVIILDRAVRHALLAVHSDEADARIDSGIGETDIEPAIKFRGLIEGAVERGMIGDVDSHAANVPALGLEALGLGVEPFLADIEHGDARAVFGEHFDEAQANPRRAPRTDRALPLNLVHV